MNLHLIAESETSSQNLNLQLSQSQAEMSSSMSNIQKVITEDEQDEHSERVVEPPARELQEIPITATSHWPSQDSQPQTSSIGDPSMADEMRESM